MPFSNQVLPLGGLWEHVSVRSGLLKMWSEQSELYLNLDSKSPLGLDPLPMMADTTDGDFVSVLTKTAVAPCDSA